jgi:hypothetical protein
MGTLARLSLQKGMAVRDDSGRRVGVVYLLGDCMFEVRHRWPSHHFLLGYEEIVDLRGGEVRVRQGRAFLRQGKLGDAGQEPPTTLKPIVDSAQLHLGRTPLDRWDPSAALPLDPP